MAKLTEILPLNNLHLLQDIIGLLRGDGELGHGVGQGGLGLLGLLLHQHDPPGKSRNVGLHFPVTLVLLLVSQQSLVQLVQRLVELNLQPVHLLTEVPDVAVGLVGPSVGLLGLLLKVVDDGVETVGLRLERLPIKL